MRGLNFGAFAVSVWREPSPLLGEGGDSRLQEHLVQYGELQVKESVAANAAEKLLLDRCGCGRLRADLLTREVQVNRGHLEWHLFAGC